MSIHLTGDRSLRCLNKAAKYQSFFREYQKCCTNPRAKIKRHTTRQRGTDGLWGDLAFGATKSGYGVS